MELDEYRNHLITQGLTINTIASYIRDIRAYTKWLNGESSTQNSAELYIEDLYKTHKPNSVYSTITALRSFFSYTGQDIKLQHPKNAWKQKTSPDIALTKEEYARLLQTAKANEDERMSLMLQSMFLMGVRVSELQRVTVEAANAGKIEITTKSSSRTIHIPEKLNSALLQYIEQRGIQSGSVFVTQNGKHIARNNIWMGMKKLCRMAGVPEEKVFPDNLRRVLAREYFEKYQEAVGLADALGG
jgi:site-specific recombinase XerD